VRLAFSLPGQNSPITIQGRVLSSSDASPPAVGDKAGDRTSDVEVQFADLSHADIARLKAWALQAIPPAPDRS
jgi:hypothetical protein